MKRGHTVFVGRKISKFEFPSEVVHNFTAILSQLNERIRFQMPYKSYERTNIDQLSLRHKHSHHFSARPNFPPDNNESPTNIFHINSQLSTVSGQLFIINSTRRSIPQSRSFQHRKNPQFTKISQIRPAVGHRTLSFVTDALHLAIAKPLAN